MPPHCGDGQAESIGHHYGGRRSAREKLLNHCRSGVPIDGHRYRQIDHHTSATASPSRTDRAGPDRVESARRRTTGRAGNSPGGAMSSQPAFHNANVTYFALQRNRRPGRVLCDWPRRPGLPTRHDGRRTAVRRLPTLLLVSTDGAVTTGQLNQAETHQFRRLRRWGTVGALLMAYASSSSYGAANPIPNPMSGVRILGLLTRVGPAALAVSYTGVALVVLCWFLLGRLAVPGRPRRLTRGQLARTLALWAAPFLLTPPIFSRDVYSYLAVGAMMTHGDNPYQQGPYDALGDANPLAHQVDVRWQHTTTPYGPAFLLVMKAVVLVTGDHVLRGVLLARGVELVGVALIVWALPRLARRCGVDPVAVLWLGALNPLLLFHLIAGAHNEALMLGLMLAGLVIGMERSIFLGTVLIAVAVGIKVTAILALAFLVIYLARRRGGRWTDLFAVGAMVGATAVGSFALLSWAAGHGIGWLTALGTPGTVRSFLSVTTSLGVASGQTGLLLGLGDHTDAAISTLHPVGTAVAALIALVLMWRSWRGALEPMFALGLAMAGFVILGPVIQPWYLLWAVLPLAASAADGRYRKVAAWLTAAYAVIIMPNGATIPVFAIVQSVLVAAVVAGAVLAVLAHHGLPVSRPPVGRDADPGGRRAPQDDEGEVLTPSRVGTSSGVDEGRHGGEEPTGAAGPKPSD